jgi:hypothetical protein
MYRATAEAERLERCGTCELAARAGTKDSGLSRRRRSKRSAVLAVADRRERITHFICDGLLLKVCDARQYKLAEFSVLGSRFSISVLESAAALGYCFRERMPCTDGGAIEAGSEGLSGAPPSSTRTSFAPRPRHRVAMQARASYPRASFLGPCVVAGATRELWAAA